MVKFLSNRPSFASVDYRLSLDDTNVVKCLAICAMLFHHLFIDHIEFGSTIASLAEICKVCVAIFVFLSGYGITTQFSQKRLMHIQYEKKNMPVKALWWRICFLLKRFVKFYFNYWFVFFIAVALAVFLFGKSLPDIYSCYSKWIVGFIVDFWGMGGYESFNITWWFNRVILSCWVLFPLCYWMLNRKFVCGWFLVLLLLDPGNVLYPLNFIAGGLSFCIVPFSLGIFFVLYADLFSKIVNKIDFRLLFALPIFLRALLLFARMNFALNFVQLAWVDSLFSFFLAFWVICLNKLLGDKFTHVAGFVGKHSMNMYLIHTFFCNGSYSKYLYALENPFFIFAALLLLSLFVSISIEFVKDKIGFYRLLEKIIGKVDV